MAAVSLYRKWRPQTFANVMGQEHITTTLQNAIRANRVAHAYLFTGPRGTGKTTTARIFAKAISCLDEDETKRPCNVCEVCVSVNEGRDLDLIEIDAASNNGVDNVRELRERIGFAPNVGRYKIYIIDEVHMLSTGAFNALLKTLEEPPAHAIFILATTEVDKLPATVLSRCQRFDFRFMPFKLLREQLAMIAEKEGAHIEPGALDLFARQAGGSMRDGISLLDQMIAYGDGTVTLKQAQAILGSVASQSVSELTNYLIARDVPNGLNLINQTLGDGADPRQFLRETLEYLRGLLLLRGSPDGGLLNLPAETIAEMKTQTAALPTADLLVIIKLFQQAVAQLRNAPQPQLPIEVAFVEATLRGMVDTAHATPEVKETPKAEAPRATTPPRAVAPPPREAPAQVRETRPTLTGPAAGSAAITAPAKTGSPPAKASVPPADSKAASKPVVPANEAPPVSKDDPGGNDLQKKWEETLAAIKPQNRNLEAILKAGTLLGLENGVIVLGFPYDFHKSKAEEPKSKQLLEEVLSIKMAMPLRVRCEIVKGEGKRAPVRPKDKKQVAMEDPLVKAIVNKFNAHIAEVEDVPPEEPPNE
jgi:DNA polymerase III subunit gamma/tau